MTDISHMYGSLIEKALRVAVVAHKEQVRKDDASPYIVHPVMVGIFLMGQGFDETVIAAAFVHDVLEDTDVTFEQLRDLLGDEVLAIVDAVSHDNALPWKEKKLGYIEKVRNGPDGAKAVCVADHIYNCENTIATYQKDGPALWEKFSRGRNDRVWFEEATLAMLRESWEHPLVEKYTEVVEQLRSLV